MDTNQFKVVESAQERARSETRELADRAYALMLDYATTRVMDEQAKKDRVEKELAETGKTKATYDENVFTACFLWSFDVLVNDLKCKYDESGVRAALQLLMDENKVERWVMDGKPMNCFYLRK